MFKIEGIRKNGMKIHKTYNNEKVARFEYELTQMVSQEIKLFKDDKLLEEFIKQEEELVTYVLRGESPFNKIHKVIKNDLKRAELEFKSETHRCDWIALYEKKNGEENQIDLYIKGVA